MTFPVVICERARVGMGRNQNKTYVNVLKSLREITGADIASWLAANSGHPWADPSFNEFIIQITQQEYLDFRDGVNPLTHDFQNEPRWQQETATSGDPSSFGSFADPESAASTWQPGVELPDDRFIVRIYNGDPLAAGVHIALETLEEELVTGFVVRHLRLFTADDTPSNTNAQDQQTEIAGKQMIFDFTAGVTTFNVSVLKPGNISFPSNHRYRVVGPGGESQVTWQIFGRTLEVEE